MDDAGASRSANPETAPVASVGDGVARREGRGFVTSYGDGRQCATSGCSTSLSRYNSGRWCWLHNPESDKRRG